MTASSCTTSCKSLAEALKSVRADCAQVRRRRPTSYAAKIAQNIRVCTPSLFHLCFVQFLESGVAGSAHRLYGLFASAVDIICVGSVDTTGCDKVEHRRGWP